MLHNNCSRRPEPETPPPSSVQDYLARKYASLGIHPTEPNAHQPDNIPATPSDERSGLASTTPESGSRNPEADAALSHTEKTAERVRSVRFENPQSTTASPAPGPAAPATEAAPSPKPLTRHQRSALDLLDRGLSVTEIMDTLGYSRKTFYDWGKANPAFAHGAESARDNRRGVLVDSVHDLQLAALSLVGNYIRSDNSPDSVRLRAASLVFRHAHSETLLPRRILATFSAPDGISPASTGPDIPDPLDPPQEDPGGPCSDQAPSEREQCSGLASTPSKQHSDLATTTPQAESHEAEPVSTATAPSHKEKTAESVRSVRFENTQSTSSADNPTAGGAPRSMSSSDNTAPGDEQSDVAKTNGDEQSDVAPPPPAKPRETLLTDAFLAATFLHKHEPHQAFERLLKHHMGAYAPATPQEELLTFRITQKSWILRRLDTFDRVIADSAVTKVREQHPNAAPAACIAMTFLTRNDTEETSFYARIANQRKDHEAALDRLETKLQTLQTRREARQDRHHAREDRHASAARKHQSTVQSIPLTFHPTPNSTLRATG
jgi:hypothetical protein